MAGKRLDGKLSDDEIRELLLVGTSLEADIRQVVGHAANYGADTYGDGDPSYLRHVVDILRDKWSVSGPVNPDFKSNITWTKSDPPEDGSVIEQDDVSYRLRDTEKDDRKYHDR